MVKKIYLFQRLYTLPIGDDITSVAGDTRIRGKHSYPISNRKDFMLIVNRHHIIGCKTS